MRTEIRKIVIVRRRLRFAPLGLKPLKGMVSRNDQNSGSEYEANKRRYGRQLWRTK